jgi:hypothetical protein
MAPNQLLDARVLEHSAMRSARAPKVGQGAFFLLISRGRRR